MPGKPASPFSRLSDRRMTYGYGLAKDRIQKVLTPDGAGHLSLEEQRAERVKAAKKANAFQGIRDRFNIEAAPFGQQMDKDANIGPINPTGLKSAPTVSKARTTAPKQQPTEELQAKASAKHLEDEEKNNLKVREASLSTAVSRAADLAKSARARSKPMRSTYNELQTAITRMEDAERAGKLKEYDKLEESRARLKELEEPLKAAESLADKLEADAEKAGAAADDFKTVQRDEQERIAIRSAQREAGIEPDFDKNPYGSSMEIAKNGKLAPKEPISISGSRVMKDRRRILETLSGSEKINAIRDQDARETDPVAWERGKLESLKGMTDADLEAAINGYPVVIEQAKQSIASIIADREQRMADRGEELAVLAQNNADLLNRKGVRVSELTTDESTGEKWHNAFHTRRVSLVNAENQDEADTQAELEAEQAEYERDIRVHNARIAELNARNAKKNDKARLDREAELIRLEQSGQKTLAGDIRKATEERAARVAEVEKKYAQGTPEHDAAVKAIQGDVETKVKASQKKSQEAFTKAAGAYGEFRDFYGDFTKGKAEDGYKGGAGVDVSVANDKIKAKAKELGIDEGDFRAALETMRQSDWSKPASAKAIQTPDQAWWHALKKGLDIEGELEPTRTLPDGRIIVNPALAADKDGYNKAIDATGASDSIKAEAKANYARDHEQWLDNVRGQLETSQDMPWNESYMAFRNKRAGQMTENEIAESFLQKHKNAPWHSKLSKLVVDNLMAGSHMLTTSAAGAYAAVAGMGEKAIGVNLGSQAASEFAADKATDMDQAAVVSRMTTDGIPARVASTVLQMVPGAAATIATGGMTGAALMSAVQTGGTQYAQVYSELRNQGLDHDQAWKQAAPAATWSGAMSAALVRLFPRGLTALADKAGRQALAGPIEQAARGFAAMSDKAAKGFADEAIQETIDEGLSQMSEAYSLGKGPNEAIAQFIEHLPEIVLSAGLMGAAVEVINNSPEKQASFDAQVENFVPAAGAAPEEVQRLKTMARTIAKIAAGEQPASLKADELESIGWSAAGKPGKEAAVYERDGQLVIRDQAINEVATAFPAFDQLGVLDEQERLDQIASMGDKTKPESAGQSELPNSDMSKPDASRASNQSKSNDIPAQDQDSRQKPGNSVAGGAPGSPSVPGTIEPSNGGAGAQGAYAPSGRGPDGDGATNAGDEQMDRGAGVLPRPGQQQPGTGGGVDEAAHQAATSPTNDLKEPTDAQKQAGNYKMGHPNSVDTAAHEAVIQDWDRQNKNKQGNLWFEEAHGNTPVTDALNRAATSGGADLATHGMAKRGTLTQTMRDLLDLLKNGTNPSKNGGVLHTAPLAVPTGSAGAHAGTTASGTSYRDGPFILVNSAEASRNKVGIRDMSTVAAVLVNDANASQLEAIRALIGSIRPDIIVDLYSKADQVAAALTGKAGSSSVDTKAHEAATSKTNNLPEPTAAQKAAGNYRMGHLNVSGLSISIENPDGSTRKWTNDSGESGESTMHGHYGYMKNTTGNDGDHIDVNIKPGTPEDWNGTAYVIKQLKSDGKTYDEDKVYVGYESEAEAKRAYKSNYQKGWRGYGGAIPVQMSDLAKLVKSGKLKKSPSNAPQDTNQGKEAGLRDGGRAGVDPQSKPGESDQGRGAGQTVPEDVDTGKDDQGVGTKTTEARDIPGQENADTKGGDKEAAQAPVVRGQRAGGSQPPTWSIKTDSGKTLTIPANEAATRGEAIGKLAAMSARGDKVRPGTLQEPQVGVPTQVEEDQATQLGYSLPSDATVHDLDKESIGKVVARIAAILEAWVADAPADLSKTADDIRAAIIAHIVPYLKTGQYQGVIIATGEYDVKQHGAGYAVHGDRLVIYPRHFARGVLGHALASGASFSEVAEGLIELGPFHEFAHNARRKALTEEETADVWRSLEEKTKADFRQAYNYGANVKMSDAQLGDEFLRHRMEMIFLGKTTEEVFGKAIRGNKVYDAIVKIIEALADILRDARNFIKTEAGIKRLNDAEARLFHQIKNSLPPEVLAMFEARAKQEGRVISVGDIDSSAQRSQAQSKASPIGAPQRVKNLIQANFAALLDKMGIQLVPNYTGPSAHYVISEDIGGGRKKRGGYIEYNPARLAERSPGQIMEMGREEMIHAALDKALVELVKPDEESLASGQYHIDFYTRVHDLMTPAEREMVKKAYKSHGNRPYYIGSEFARMAIQRHLFGGITEQAFLGDRSAPARSKAMQMIKKLFQSMLDFMKRIAKDKTPAGRQAARVMDDAIKILKGIEAQQKMVMAMASPAVAPAQDREYLAAVRSGDMTKAQQMVDKAAKAKGFLEMWHGTNAAGMPESGDVFFTDDKHYARSRGKNIVRVWVDPRDSKDSIMDDGGWSIPIVERDYIESARREGYSSVRLINPEDGDSFMVILDRDKIKSADPVTRDDAGNVIPLSQRFNSASNAIRAMAAPDLPIRTAVKINGKVVLGNPGQTHYDIAAHWIKHNELEPYLRNDPGALGYAKERINAKWWEEHDFKMGFMGNEFLSRGQAWKYLEGLGYQMPYHTGISNYMDGEILLDSLDLAEIKPPKTMAMTAPSLPPSEEWMPPSAIKTDLGVFEGYPGQLHAELENKYLRRKLAGSMPVSSMSDRELDKWKWEKVKGQARIISMEDRGDIERGFMSKNGFVTRAQAMDDLPQQVADYIRDVFAMDELDSAVGGDFDRETARTLRMASPALPVDPQLGLSYVGGDERTSQARRNESNPLDPRAGTRPGGGFGGATTQAALLDWAAEQGWLIETDSLVSRLAEGGDVTEIPGGDEHDVWFDPKTQRAIKLTLDDKFIQGTPERYIENLRRTNEEFDTGYAFEGVVNDEGKARIVTSQPWLDGQPATEQQIDAYFLDRDFKKIKDGAFYDERRKYIVGDALPKNVKRVGNQTRPFDIQTRFASEREASKLESAIQARENAMRWMASPEFDSAKAEQMLLPFRELPAADEGGATMNLDGSKYEGGGLVVPVISENVNNWRSITAEKIGSFLDDAKDYTENASQVMKVGIYKFPASPKASIDLNIVAPASARDEALKIGAELGQESLFDLDTFENIKTGASGDNPQRPTVEQVSAIGARLMAMAGPLIGLPSKVKIPGLGEREFGPWQTARDVASSYMAKAGLPYSPPRTYAKVDKERAGRIAAEFDRMKHDPADPAVAASYRAMIDETLAQWEAIKATGLKVEPVPAGAADPYDASPRLAQIDAVENNHLWFFPTDNGFGNNVTGFDPKDNPLFEFTGETLPGGHKMRANDVFRIVHDYFGHFKEGVGFRADGEENAWRQHSSMYSDKARGAMTSETRGQNSWLNFGPYGEKNRTAKTGDTVFADQKIGLMPEWTWYDGAGDDLMAMAAPDELNLGKKADKNAMRQRNVRRIIERNSQAHPEALKVEYVKDGKDYRLDERGLPQPVPQEYNLLDSRLAKESAKGKRGDARRGPYITALADKLKGMFDEVKDQADIMAGKEWYRIAREKLKKHFGDDTLVFAQLLAATSARTPVQQNFEQALDAYNGIRSGRFDGLSERYMEAIANMEAGSLFFRQSIGNSKIGDAVTPRNFRDYLDSEGILPRRENGKKYNANSLQVLNVIAGIWREKLGGPKTAQFSDNLTGASMEATIDMWAARTLHRLSNEHNGRWRILPEAETGVNNEDFDVGQAAFKIAASRLGMNPDDLQGVLWFAEKRLWAARGWTRGAGSELSDFSSLLDYTEADEGGKKVLRLDRNQGMLGLDYGNDANTNREPGNTRLQATGHASNIPGPERVRTRGAGQRSAGAGTGRGAERAAAAPVESTLFMASPFDDRIETFYRVKLPNGSMMRSSHGGLWSNKSKARAERVAASQGGSVETSQVTTKVSNDEKIERGLVIRHNLSPDNLRHVLRVGGIPVPSIAVTRAKNEFSSFGSITLLGGPDLVDPRADKNAKVFNADIYSPRYPTIEFEYSHEDKEKIRSILNDVFNSNEWLRNSSAYRPESVISEARQKGMDRALRDSDVAMAAWIKSFNPDRLESIANDTTDSWKRNMLRSEVYNNDAGFQRWIDELVSTLNPKKKMFIGHNYLGKRIYREATLDRITRSMSKKIRNAEGFDYGVPSLRALVAKQLRSIKAIQDSRDSIISESDMETAKEETTAEFEALFDDAKFERDEWPSEDRSMDTFTDDMKAAAEGDHKHLREHYNNQEFRSRIYGFLAKLRDMETEYFEAKITRVVQLPEFRAAIVPENEKEIAQRLRDKGIDVRLYPRSAEGNRKLAVQQAAIDHGILFMAAPYTADDVEVSQGPEDEEPSTRYSIPQVGEALVTDDGFIWGLDVDPDKRQRGAARAILERIIDDRGGEPLGLTAKADKGGMPQDKLEEFYGRLGFEPEGGPDANGQLMIRRKVKRPTRLADVMAMSAPAMQAIKDEWAQEVLEAKENDYKDPDMADFIRRRIGMAEEAFPTIWTEDFGDPASFKGLAYHHTNPQSVQDIKEQGLKPSWGTGIENTSTYGVFTSAEPDAMETYGPVLVTINVGALKDANKDISTGLEGPIEDQLRLEAVARELGMDESEIETAGFGPSSGFGIQINTLVIKGRVGPEFIKIEGRDGKVLHEGQFFKTRKQYGLVRGPDGNPLVTMAGPNTDPQDFDSKLLSRMVKSLEGTKPPDGKTIEENQALVEALRQSDNDPETVMQWTRKANAMIRADRQAVIDQVIENYYNGASFGSPELAIAASILQPEMFRDAMASGDSDTMRKAQAFAYASGAGATQAGRELRALHNKNRPNKDMVRDVLSSLYSAVPARKRGRIAAAPTPMEKQKKIADLQAKIIKLEKQIRSGDHGKARELIATRQQEKLAREEKDKQQLIEAYTNARRDSVVKALKAEGISEDDIFISPEDRLAAHDSDMVKEAMAKHPESQHDAIRYLMRGYSHEQVAKLTGLPVSAVATIHERFRNVTLKKSVASWVNKGRSVLDLIREGIGRVFGVRQMAAPKTVPWSSVQRTTTQPTPRPRKQTQPKIDTSVANEIDRQLAVLMPTATQVNSGKLHATVARTKDGKEASIYAKFNPDDFRSVYRIARALSIAEASTFDKLYEYWINNLLSGITTNVVNIIGNTLSTAIHFLPQRIMEIAWNAGGLVDPDSASIGEIGQIVRGILPGVRQALANAWMAFDVEADPVNHLYMDEPMRIEFDHKGDIDKIGGYRGPSAGGLKGRVIRLPGRSLRAMDAAFKSMIMNMEVGAQAYRLAMVEHSKGNMVDVETYIRQQVNTPGSDAWRRSMEIAEELTFQNSNWVTRVAKHFTQGLDRPVASLKQQAGELRSKGDPAGAFIKDADAVILAAFSKMMQIIFPFVKTPSNILRTGLRKSPLGSLVLPIHILHAIVRGGYNLSNGKPVFQDYPTALLIKSMAEQTQAWVVVAALLSMAEGDDDDDKKDIIFIGGRPQSEAGETAAAYRDYGGTYMLIIRDDKGKDKARIPFGKYEPVATALGTTIDAMRQLKMMARKSPQGAKSEDVEVALKAIIGDFANQAENKSFLQGFATLMKEYDSIKRSGDIQGGIAQSAKRSILSAIIPNLIRQTRRNLDDIVRDSKKSDVDLDMLPWGLSGGPMMDMFGRESVKEEWFPGSRLFLPAANKENEDHPIEPLIREWNNKNLNSDDQVAPTPMKRSDYYAYGPGGAKIKLETVSDKTIFEKRIGQEFARRTAALAKTLEGKPLPANFKELIDGIRADVRRETRQKFITSPFQPMKDRLLNQPKLP